MSSNRNNLPKIFDDSFYKIISSVDTFFDKAFDQLSSSIRQFPFEVKSYETQSYYIVEADLRGYSIEQIHFDVEDSFLKIGLEDSRESIIQYEDKGRYHEEKSYQRMERFIPVARKISRSDIKASFNDGILQVIIPKV
jgi:HSP20 family protein